ncbi:hypothetical protein BDW22DRAFT_1456092 [Trametopsis cervina]|nr:hypothetical protein BDW22DRAFT_1456092 [Trametopsis cervina]
MAETNAVEHAKQLDVHSTKGNKKGNGKKEVRLRGLPSDSPETRVSKTVTWVLRHGAQQEGLALRPDGYARVQDLVSNPPLQMLDFPTLERLVKDDKKNRYNLVYEPDVDNIHSPVWWIRANQGHTMKTISVVTIPIKRPEDIPTRIAVHGTNKLAWEQIRHQGLSRMKRNHIHLAQGLPGTGVVSGMRRNAAIFIYIDVQKALDAGIKFDLSSNGVVLSEGDKTGFIHPRFFARVENSKGEVLENWQVAASSVDNTASTASSS